MTDKLRKAAEDVIARWDSPNWKLDIHTGVFIQALREALQADHIEESLVMVQPEPVAWMYEGEPSFDGKNWHTNYELTTSKNIAIFKCGAIKKPTPLYTTPPSVDALIAEIDGITEYAYDDFKGVECLPKAKVIAILDKYRGVK